MKIPATICCSIVVILFCSCSTRQIVSSYRLEVDTTKSIAITTIQGDRIVMESGKYSLIRYSDSTSIYGKGIISTLGNSNQKAEFEGEIGNASVKRIEIEQTRGPEGIHIALYVLGVIVLAALVGVFTFGHGVGG